MALETIAMMSAQIAHRCEQHADIFACPDALIVYNPKFDEYGVIICGGELSLIPNLPIPNPHHRCLGAPSSSRSGPGNPTL